MFILGDIDIWRQHNNISSFKFAIIIILLKTEHQAQGMIYFLNKILNCKTSSPGAGEEVAQFLTSELRGSCWPPLTVRPALSMKPERRAR